MDPLLWEGALLGVAMELSVVGLAVFLSAAVGLLAKEFVAKSASISAIGNWNKKPDGENRMASQYQGC